jgi:hypothetical protein
VTPKILAAAHLGKKLPIEQLSLRWAFVQQEERG